MQLYVFRSKQKKWPTFLLHSLSTNKCTFYTNTYVCTERLYSFTMIGENNPKTIFLSPKSLKRVRNIQLPSSRDISGRTDWNRKNTDCYCCNVEFVRTFTILLGLRVAVWLKLIVLAPNALNSITTSGALFDITLFTQKHFTQFGHSREMCKVTFMPLWDLTFFIQTLRRFSYKNMNYQIRASFFENNSSRLWRWSSPVHLLLFHFLSVVQEFFYGYKENFPWSTLQYLPAFFRVFPVEIHKRKLLLRGPWLQRTTARHRPHPEGLLHHGNTGWRRTS